MKKEIKTNQTVGKNIYINGYITKNRNFYPTFHQ